MKASIKVKKDGYYKVVFDEKEIDEYTRECEIPDWLYKLDWILETNYNFCKQELRNYWHKAKEVK